MNRSAIWISGAVLAAFGVLGTALVSFTHLQTRDRIAANERLALLRQLNVLVPAESVDNDMINDRIRVHDPELLGAEETRVYRGRLQGKPVAAVFTSQAPDGYSGPIKLLVAVRRDGNLGGVRVVNHRETPGLGDKIEEDRSDWVLGFAGKSLADPLPERWKVEKDGGDFDQFTGATITPRAVVSTVKNTLLYYQQHAGNLFRPLPETPEATAVEATEETEK
ncbi:MAG: electron transport complex subunit RsxG [Pseudomonadota bacterium]